MLRKNEIQKKLDRMKTQEHLSLYDLGYRAGYRDALTQVLKGIE